jgi:hypothetical protein
VQKEARFSPRDGWWMTDAPESHALPRLKCSPEADPLPHVACSRRLSLPRGTTPPCADGVKRFSAFRPLLHHLLHRAISG